MKRTARRVLVLDAVLLGLACGLSALLAEILSLSVLDPNYRRVLAYDALVLELAGAYGALFGLLGASVGVVVAIFRGRLERPLEAARLTLLTLAMIPVLASALAFRPALEAFVLSAPGVVISLALLGSVIFGLFVIYRRGSLMSRTRALPLLALVFTVGAGADAFVLQHLLAELAAPATLLRALFAGALMAVASAPLAYALSRAPNTPMARGPWPALAALIAATALALFLPLPSGAPEPPTGLDRAARPSVLLVVIDTLRADHVTRELMPRLMEFGETAQRFDRATATAPWTTPSFGSLLSSQYPAEHRAGTAGAGGGRARMLGNVQTLPELLSEHGYFTHAVLTNPYVSPRYGLQQGFDRYENLLGINTYHPIAFWLSSRSLLPHRTHYLRAGIQDLRIRRALDEAQRRAQPFFVLAHFMDPHWPYRAPSPFGLPAGASRAESYAAEVRYLDAVLGALLDDLARSGRLRNTVVAVMSDHGEEIGELRLGEWKDHGHTLHEELLHVPLFVRRPGGEGAPIVRSDVVSLIDVAPTIARLVGLEPPGAWRGLDLLHSEAPLHTATRAVIAEAILTGPEQKAARKGDRKIIAPAKRLDRVHAELFDLERDPREQRAQPIPPDSEAYALLRLLRAHRDMTSAAGEAGDPGVAMDPVLEEQLRSLGYVD